MWARMSDAELLQKSHWVVVGEWVGQTALRPPASEPLELGVIAVSEVLRGPRDSSVALVALRVPAQPVASDELRFKRGDRGLWFLRLQSPAETGGPYVLDHPQRFVRDTPENAAAIAAWRRQLRGP